LNAPRLRKPEPDSSRLVLSLELVLPRVRQLAGSELLTRTLSPSRWRADLACHLGRSLNHIAPSVSSGHHLNHSSISTQALKLLNCARSGSPWAFDQPMRPA
jgi:hypothetical protein